MTARQRDDVKTPQRPREPTSALTPFAPALTRPSLFLLAGGVSLAIGVVVGVAASSAFIGAGAVAAAILGPVLILVRLTASSHQRTGGS